MSDESKKAVESPSRTRQKGQKTPETNSDEKKRKNKFLEPDKNIIFTPPPKLSWEPGHAAASAQQLAEYASSEAQSAISWYLEKKESKKTGARALRGLAIGSTAVAGFIPIFSQIWPGNFEPALASIALIFAATAIGMDRFFGYSTSWMRFLTTEMKIRRVLHEFLLNRELIKVQLRDSIPDADAIQAQVQQCKDLIDQVNQILSGEMDEWVQEFRQNLVEIDKAAKTQAQAMIPGSVNLEINNGDDCDGGWELFVDNGSPTKRTGRTAAVLGLLPGPHLVRAKGLVKDSSSGETKTLQAETAFTVISGQTETLALKLE